MAIGSVKHEPTWAQELLEVKDRSLGEITAPPSGLYLMKVKYPESLIKS